MLSHFNCVQLFATLWTVAWQAPLFMGFSRKECWRELPFPSLGNLPDSGIEPACLTSPALEGGFFTTSATANGDCCHEMKRCLLLGISYDQPRQHIKKQRHYFANKHLSSQTVVMYGCESWTIKKADHRRIDAFELWCWRRLVRVPWTARRSS